MMTAVQTDTGDGDQRRTFRPWDRSHDAEVLDVLDVLDVPDDLEEPDDLASRFADEELALAQHQHGRDRRAVRPQRGDLGPAVPPDRRGGEGGAHIEPKNVHSAPISDLRRI